MSTRYMLEEERCTAIGLKLRAALVFVVRALRQQRDSRDEFARDLRTISGPAGDIGRA